MADLKEPLIFNVEHPNLCGQFYSKNASILSADTLYLAIS